MLVSVPVSRPLLSSVTPRVTLVSVSRPLRKSLPPSVLLSSLPSSAFCPSGEVTGVPTSVSLTLCPSSRAPSVVPFPSEYVMIERDSCVLQNITSLTAKIAYPRPPWYRSRCLPRCQASPPACRCPRRLHLVLRFHQDLENTLKATFLAVVNTYGFLTPNLWKETKLIRSPLEEFSDVLRQGKKY